MAGTRADVSHLFDNSLDNGLYQQAPYSYPKPAFKGYSYPKPQIQFEDGDNSIPQVSAWATIFIVNKKNENYNWTKKSFLRKNWLDANC